MRRINDHITERDLPDGRRQLVIQRGQNYHDRDTGQYEATPAEIAADERVSGFGHVHKGRAWKRLARGGKYRIGFGVGQSITYRPVGAVNVVPTISGNVATYASLWPGVDVELQMAPEGVKETLHSHGAVINVFTWDVDLQGVLLDPSGEIVEPLTGRVIGRLLPPTAVYADGERPCVLTIAGAQVTITAEPGWQSIDPTTWTYQPAAEGIDTYIDAAMPDTPYGTSTSIFVGTDGGGAMKSIYIQPSLSGLSIPAGQAIRSAELALYCSSVTSSLTMVLKRVTSAWVETMTYNNTTATEDSTVLASVASAANVWRTWTGLAALVRGWLAGTYANYGVRISRDTATASNRWSAFYSSDYVTDITLRPKWTVVYGARPTAALTSPTGTQGAPTIANTVTPTVSGTYSTTDGGAQSAYRFRLLDAAGLALADQGKTAGTGNSWTVPAGKMEWGKAYQIEMTVYDSYDTDSAVVIGWIIARPAAPTALAAVGDADNAHVDLAWVTSATAGVVGSHAYRRIPGGPWRRLTLALTAATNFVDRTAAKGVAFEYAVTAVMTNGTESDYSAAVSGSVVFTGTWLGDTRIALRVVPIPRPAILASKQMTVLGTYSFQHHGQGPTQLTLVIAFTSLAEYQALIALLLSGQPLPYRDADGLALLGQLTEDPATERLDVPGRFMGYITAILDEVST